MGDPLIKQIKEFFDNCKDIKSIMVIGDAILDMYYKGKVTRLSPEAPVPILSDYNIENKLGGAANVAKSLVDYARKVHMVGAMGYDPMGKLLEKAIADSKIWDHLIRCDSLQDGRRFITTSKTRCIGNKQQLLRLDNEIIVHADDLLLHQEIQGNIKWFRG
jgi:bifunctional ADP-heptose synthase (sugar kinase/adenylyltransferase)